MSHNHDQTKALLELWDVVLRFRWRFILAAFAVTTAVLLVGFWLPRKYKAEAVFERRTDMVMTELSNKGSVSRSFQDPRASLTKEIIGPAAIHELIDNIGPELIEQRLVAGESELDALRGELRHRVNVQWDISSNALDRVNVQYIGRNPKLTAMVVNGLVENYIQRTRRSMEERLNASAAFFESEVTQAQQQIEKLENQVLAFEIQNSDLLPENPNNVQIKLAEAEASLVEVIALRDAAAARVQSIKDALADTPQQTPTFVTEKNPRLVELEAKLRELRQQITTAVSTYKMTERHPDLISLREQLAAVEQEITETDAEVVTQKQLASNTKYANLELALTQAKSEHQVLAQQAESLKLQIGKFNEQQARMFAGRSTYQKLVRQTNEAQRQLAFWEDNLRRVKMALTADSGDRGVRLAVLSPATPARRPVSPNVAQVMLGAVALGLAAGALSVFLAQRTDESFNSGEDLSTACNLTLIGSVSELVTQRHRQLSRLRNLIVYPTATVAMGLVIFVVAAMLYLNLEKPAVLEQAKTAVVQRILHPAGQTTADLTSAEAKLD